jgi:hypothetical protein
LLAQTGATEARTRQTKSQGLFGTFVPNGEVYSQILENLCDASAQTGRGSVPLNWEKLRRLILSNREGPDVRGRCTLKVGTSRMVIDIDVLNTAPDSVAGGVTSPTVRVLALLIAATSSIVAWNSRHWPQRSPARGSWRMVLLPLHAVRTPGQALRRQQGHGEKRCIQVQFGHARPAASS